MTAPGEPTPILPEDDAPRPLNGSAKGSAAPFSAQGLLAQLRLASEFLETAPTLPASAALLFHRSAEDSVVRLIGERILVGRAPECDLSFPEQWEMSRRHFEIRRVGSRYVLRDLSSFNGTTIRGMPTRLGVRDLRNGDLIEAGSVTFLFTRPD